MSDLKVALLQESIVANDPAANLERFSALLPEAGSVDLIVLPEVFTTGFHPKARQSADSAGILATDWMLSKAALCQSVITGSVVLKTDTGEHVNRMLWATPEGALAYYDKRHLFRMAGEHLRYRPGEKRAVQKIGDWRLLQQVCYDLRFPVFSRNRNDYDVLVYVANWPAARHTHWRALLQARAIENLSYVIGVNRIGDDAYDQAYAGGSVIFAPDGSILLDASDQPGCFQGCLSLTSQQAYRDEFPAHLDADDFQLLIDTE